MHDLDTPNATAVSGSAPPSWGARMLTIGGLALIYLAIGAFVAAAYYAWDMKGILRPHLYQHVPEILSCSIGVFAAVLGVRLIRAGGTSPSDPLPVVNPREWLTLQEALKDSQGDPVGEYIRLSSLTGATGFFRKLDLSGLPLATIGLTLFFAICSMFPIAQAGKFIELTQLTLGAFIGSFVQKQVGAVRDREAGARSTASGSDHTVTRQKREEQQVV